jgi:hypothetical protein
MTIGRHLSSKNLQDSQPAHVEEEDKTARRSHNSLLERSGQEETKKYSLAETIIVPCSQNIQYKNPLILVSCLPVTTTVKKLPDK